MTAGDRGELPAKTRELTPMADIRSYPVLAGPGMMEAMAPSSRLAEHVTARRTSLGLGVEPAAKQAGLSKDTWKRVEHGKPVRDTTYAAIDRALRWAPGGCMAILSGHSPTSIDPIPAPPVDAAPSEALEAGITQALQNAMIATTELTAQEMRDLHDRLLNDLREHGIL